MNEVLKERLKTVPNKPGCYLMRDSRGVIIYVGKAVGVRLVVGGKRLAATDAVMFLHEILRGANDRC